MPPHFWSCSPTRRQVPTPLIHILQSIILIFQTYLTWMDNVTYCEVTKPRYGSAYPWPLNHILTWQKKQQAYKRLSALGWTAKSLEEVPLQK